MTVLSVVLATHNRPRELQRCLAALALQPVPLEVVLVDSASTPPVEETIASWDKLPANLKLHRSDEPGVSLARNLGVRESSGELIAFIDDDSFVHGDWAEHLIAAIDVTGAAAVGGACLAVFEGARPGWLSDKLLQMAGATNYGNVARYVTATRDYPYTANLGLRRSTFDDAGGFDPQLGPRGNLLLRGDDLALLTQIAARGGKIWVDPSIRVDHLIQHERLESRWYWRRFWWAGVSRARMPQPWRTALRLLVALPIRLAAYAIRRDRVYLYRVAETAGFFRSLGRNRV